MGITKYEFDRDVEVLHLVPFNFLFAVIINCFRYIRYGFYPLAWEKRLYEIRTEGYTQALEHTMWYRLPRESLAAKLAYSEGYRDGLYKRISPEVIPEDN